MVAPIMKPKPPPPQTPTKVPRPSALPKPHPASVPAPVMASATDEEPDHVADHGAASDVRLGDDSNLGDGVVNELQDGLRLGDLVRLGGVDAGRLCHQGPFYYRMI